MFIKKRSKKIGLSPGTLIHVGERKVEKTKISILDYSEEGLEETVAESIDACRRYKESETVSWINISGIHDVEMIQRLGDIFGLHPLVLEDIVNTEQRPKMDDFEDYLFIVLKMVYPDQDRHLIQYEQVSLIVGSGYVISLQEVEEDVFNPVRERIQKGKGRIRKKGSDYLAYTLIDMIIDHYFTVLEVLGEQIESLEDEAMDEPEAQSLSLIQDLKKEVLFVRKSIWPLREIINAMTRGESKIILEETVVYLRDVYDHTIQVIDTAETYRELLSGTLDVYLSNVSNRMNEVMKVLTIIATTFIPLTFIAGIYGMNFKFMPELEWVWSYPVLWIIFVLIFVLMLLWFRKKKWL
jgi:magnesium transporter